MGEAGTVAGTVATAAGEARGVVRAFAHRGRPPVRANDGIDVEVGAGELFGLLGPNGAGKTTLIRQIVGLLRPDAGVVRVFGRDVNAGPSVAAGYVAYLAQDEP